MLSTMPDFDALKGWLAARGANANCPSCGHDEWTQATELILLQSFGGDEGIVIGKGYPATALFCDNCGYIRMHLVPPSDEEEVEGKGDTEKDESAGSESDQGVDDA